MMKRVHASLRRVPHVLTVALAALVFAGAAHASLVEVEVTGLRNTRGHVRVELCTRETFLTDDCPYSGEAPAKVGETLVKIANVPPGEYAAQAYHDLTDAGVVHQTALGIPKEPIGFSNNAPLRLRGPRFSDAAFSVEGSVERITLRLRHLFGH